MKLKTVILPILVIAVGVLGFVGLKSLREDPPRREFTPRPRMVEADVVAMKPVETTISAFGRLTSAEPVVLTSEVTGTLMAGDIPFQPATEFRKGDLLVRIDDRQIRLDLNSAKSDLLTALAQVLPEIKVDFPDEFAIWQDYFNGTTFDTPIAPLPEAANQKIKLFLARFNVYKLYFTVRNLEIRLQKHYFRAPFDGAIVSTNLRIGSNAGLGARLGEIINLARMEVQVPVPTDDLPWIRRDAEVTFTSQELPGEWRGRVLRIGRAIDPQTQTVPVFISVNGASAKDLFEGVFLRADIPGRIIEGGYRLPNRALYNERFVYLIRDGKLVRQEVEIARRQIESVLLSGGIQDGDTLVTEVLQGVAPGMPAIARNLGTGREGN